jgi:hypothetical protein
MKTLLSCKFLCFVSEIFVFMIYKSTTFYEGNAASKCIYRVTDEKPLMLYLAYFLSDLNK